jgi:putative SOS response-associated peptidase YedK
MGHGVAVVVVGAACVAKVGPDDLPAALAVPLELAAEHQRLQHQVAGQANPSADAAHFGLGALSETAINPRFNMAPSQAVLTIRAKEDGPFLDGMVWGFEPAWMVGKSRRPPPINARGESLLERPLFKGAVNRGRCLILADGFYEWQAIPGQKTKQPMYIRMKGGELFAFAGLWTWGADEIPTCAIITTSPNELVAPIHDRMPVILTELGERLWLDPEAPALEAMSVLAPYPADLMEIWPVSTMV